MTKNYQRINKYEVNFQKNNKTKETKPQTKRIVFI